MEAATIGTPTRPGTALATLEPVRAEAERYTTVLASSADAALTFQTFMDPAAWRAAKVDKDGKPWPLDASGNPRDPLAAWRHGALAQLWPWLVTMNRRGAGIFVMVNEGDGRGRSAKNVQGLRALFVDDDSGTLTPSALGVAPSIVVQSKSGLHSYWRLRPGEPLEAFTPGQEALAGALGTDPAVKDLPRVMRVPGFFHVKDPAAPFLVSVVQVADVTYTLAEVLEGNGATLPAADEPRTGAGNGQGSGTDAFKRAKAWIEKRDNAAEGERNAAAFRTAAGLHDFGISAEEALDLARAWNAGNTPPLPDAEVGEVVAHAYQYARNPPGTKEDRPKPEQCNGAQHGAGTDSDRPVIVIDHDLARMGDELEAAFGAASHLGLYQRCGQIVRICTDAPPPRGLRRAPGALTIGSAGRGHLVDCASRAARWFKYDKRQKMEVAARPDSQVVGNYSERSSWGLRPLTGIVTGPTLRPDGTVLVRPGYDAETGLYFAADGASYPEIPAAPTKDDAARALDDLLDVFVDFPFVAACDRSGAVAALLTVVGRTAITGCVPAYPVTATAPGTGKTLLVDTISLIGAGSPASKIPQSDSDEETKKLMLSIALAGDRVVLWDNLHYPFGGAPIDLAITAGTVRDRVLGASEMRSAPWSAVIFATGQNLAYKGDVTRRVIPIRLDAQSEHPERRTGFTRGDLLGWVAAERPRLLVAALVVLRAFIAAGRPGQPVRDLGSFGEWVRLISSALVWLGKPDPGEAQDSIESSDDEDRQQLAALLEAWRAEFGTAARTLAEALAVEHAGPLHDALHALDPRWDGRAAPSIKRIGRALRRYARRVAGGHRLVSPAEDRTGVRLWRVEEVQ